MDSSKFGHIQLESDVNLLSLEHIIIFLAINAVHIRPRTETEETNKILINNRFSAINSISLLYIG